MRPRFWWALAMALFLLTAANLLLRVSDGKSSWGFVTELARRHGRVWIFGLYAAVTLACWVAIWVYGFIRGVRTPNVARFWRHVARNTDEMFVHFQGSDAWSALPHPLPKEAASQFLPDHWAGPFDLYVPRLGGRVKIFGRIGQYERDQAEVLASLDRRGYLSSWSTED